MSTLDNLLVKIKQDSEEKARQIVKSAEETAENTIKLKLAEAEKESGRILAEARAEALRLSDRLVSAKRLNIRDRILDAKRDTINKVFTEAISRLNNMPAEELEAFIFNSLSGSFVTGTAEIVVSNRHADIDINRINSALKTKGVLLTLSVKTGNVSGGFVLNKEGVELNQTFEALIDYSRDALEADIVNTLFLTRTDTQVR